jgi:D-alanyl-D-alanine dipeptidase
VSLAAILGLGAGSIAAVEAGVAKVELPAGFVDVGEVIPDLAVDLRYLGEDNFVGRRIDGYEASRVVLTAPAARALLAAQEELRSYGLGLLVYDAYRPGRAVAEFVRWAEDPDEQGTKDRFYPDVAKTALIPDGYIAPRSSHSRGSTVDLTLVAREDGRLVPLDMGTTFDFFSPLSAPASTEVAPQARANRLLLRALMTRHGFVPYAQEWWHFTLAKEPFPETYFDFPVR